MHRPLPAVAFMLLVMILGPTIRASRATEEEAASYPMRGVLQSVDPETGHATVSHEAVTGLMPAMTMNFALADAAELRSLHPGETFTCRLRVARDHSWIEALQKESTPATVNAAPLALSRSTELEPGDTLPDVELLDERGQSAHLRDFRGKALAISFIYLRCPLPDYCPLLNRNFQSAQVLLDRLGLGEQTHFLSISMDSLNDTPEALADFARAIGADAGRWTFAVAPEPALRTLGGSVGLEFERNGRGINHNLRTVVIDPRGTIRRVFRGNAWTAPELAAELRSAASVKN